MKIQAKRKNIKMEFYTTKLNENPKRGCLLSHLDIIEHKQVRLVIFDESNSYGFIDLFDYDHISRRAGVGIIIFEKFRSKGIGSLSLKLIEEHVSSHVPMHQLYANISSNNVESISLFKKNGYNEVGLKKDWVFYNNCLLYTSPSPRDS